MKKSVSSPAIAHAKAGFLALALAFSASLFAQKADLKFTGYPNDVHPVGIIEGLSDEQLMEVVQRQTFRFFWHGAHPISGMALERDQPVKADYYWDFINEAWDEPNFSTRTFGPDACAVGGTGFGIQSIIVAVERGWIGRDTAIGRLIKIANFLTDADAFHGIYPHFMDGKTGAAIPFDRLDDGGDIVETSYLLMGFLTAREYFNGDAPREKFLRRRINAMWNAANWAWHAPGGDKLFWHWSPNNGFDMNFPVWGWNECLITYLMSAASPTHPITKKVYEGGWTGTQGWRNGKEYYGTKLPLGNYEKGGPLFFMQYTFTGVDPTGLKDDLGIDYFEQGRAHTLINRQYCIENPKKFKGYGPDCWGLTAGDSFIGYVAHCPDVDLGVIQPTAALSSMPYAPKECTAAMRHFYYKLGDKIWSEWGFSDGFSESKEWYAKSHLAIDQGPIVGMIENHRTGLLWKLFMKIPEVQNGMKNLGFSSPHFSKK